MSFDAMILPEWVQRAGWSAIVVLNTLLIGRLITRYRQEGINIPFPTRRVLSEAVD